jgi:hypothetical protein
VVGDAVERVVVTVIALVLPDMDFKQLTIDPSHAKCRRNAD